MTPEEANEIWTRNADAYRLEVGRVTIAANRVEMVLQSILFTWLGRDAGAYADEVHERAGFRDLCDHVRRRLAQHCTPERDQAARAAIDELSTLMDDRHAHVHRVTMVRRGDTHDVLLFRPSGERVLVEAPDLPTMRSLAEQLEEVASYLWSICTRPGEVPTRPSENGLLAEITYHRVVRP